MSGASLPLIYLSKSRPFQSLFAATLLLVSAAAARGQTKLDRQLSYIDLGVQAAGQFTSSTSGTVTIPAVEQGLPVSQNASSTVGALVTLRYSPRPYLGAEINGSYARYTENFTYTPRPLGSELFQIQTQANEFTFGYLVTPPYSIFGVKPYASAGVGVMRFAPTAGGGEQAPSMVRPAYYYNLGVEQSLSGGRFGLRVGFRQVFFIAPDFYQNYLTINKHIATSEPIVGVYVHF